MLNKHISEKDYYSSSEAQYQIEYLYVPISQIVGDRDGVHEHYEIYDYALENPENNYYNMTPVTVKKSDNGKYIVSDGFHRLNFCVKFGWDLPCVIFTAKDKTHNHQSIEVGYHYFYRVSDSDCEKDMVLGKYRTMVECIKTGKHITK